MLATLFYALLAVWLVPILLLGAIAVYFAMKTDQSDLPVKGAEFDGSSRSTGDS